MEQLMQTVEALLERWKSILVSLAALVVIVLQILNMVLTGGGHESIQKLIDKVIYKTEAVNTKADALARIANGNREEINGLKAELNGIEQKIDGH